MIVNHKMIVSLLHMPDILCVYIAADIFFVAEFNFMKKDRVKSVYA